MDQIPRKSICAIDTEPIHSKVLKICVILCLFCFSISVTNILITNYLCINRKLDALPSFNDNFFFFRCRAVEG